MELTEKQQVIELIKKSQNILLTTHVNPDGDALGSILALYLTLSKLGKNVTAVSPSEAPLSFNFLPSIDKITSQFNGMKDFVISVDLTNGQIDKLGYKKDIQRNKLNIVVTPKSGNFSPEDISFTYGKNKFDLIVVLDAPDLDRLGKIYDSNTDFFYETPIINIDHHPGNDHFGKVNWVDLTATSTSEILVSLIEALSREKQLIDADISTCLLTGITTDTSSFQNTNTTPKSLTVAAQLVASGARQQEIVQKIYKTKDLSTLKLWGLILTRVIQEENNFVYSYVLANDFMSCGAQPLQTQGVIDELLKTVPGNDFAMLISEKDGGVHGSLRATKKTVNVASIAKLFGGGGHEQAAAFQIENAKFFNIKDDMLAKIRDYQNQNTNSLIDNDLTNKTFQMPDSDKI
jgi:phosphoesterase RecJ-like protein